MTVTDFVPLSRATPADARDESMTPVRISRSMIARMLWGKAPEYCADCGHELGARGAYRVSATQQYCSIEHAVRDRAERIA
jgi:hypothetical protein